MKKYLFSVVFGMGFIMNAHMAQAETWELSCPDLLHTGVDGEPRDSYYYYSENIVGNEGNTLDEWKGSLEKNGRPQGDQIYAEKMRIAINDGKAGTLTVDCDYSYPLSWGEANLSVHLSQETMRDAVATYNGKSIYTPKGYKSIECDNTRNACLVTIRK